MKVSELIERLTILKEQNGDLEMRLENGDESSIDGASLVAAKQQSPSSMRKYGAQMTGPYNWYPKRIVIWGEAIL
jgi:hypothetical protein